MSTAGQALAAKFHPDEVERITGWFTAVGLAVLVFVATIQIWDRPQLVRFNLIVWASVLAAVRILPAIFTWQDPGRYPVAWLLAWSTVTIIIVVQMVPMPGFLLDHLGAWPDFLRKEYPQLVRRITPTPLHTLTWWAVFTACFLAAWMVSSLSHRQVVLVLWGVALTATFQALYGLGALIQASDTILGLGPRPPGPIGRDATGTFLTRTHYAAFFEMAWPLTLSLLLLRKRTNYRDERRALRYALMVVVCLVFGIAVFASHSRMGTLSVMVGLIVYGWLVARQAKRGDERYLRWLPWFFASVALLGALWFGMGDLVERFMRAEDDAGGRLDWIWIPLVRDLPLSTWILGAGAGSYPDVYTMVQPIEKQTSSFHAHNDYLELFLDVGVIGVALIVLVFGNWIRKLWPEHLRGPHLGAIAGIIAIALHSLTDFSLHQLGNNFLFWVSLGLLTNTRLESRRRRRRRRRSPD